MDSTEKDISTNMTPSVEQIDQWLTKKPDLSSNIRQIMGRDNAKALIDLLFNEEVIAIDRLIINNELDHAASAQYIQLVPEIAEIESYLYSITDNIIKHLKPTLRRKFLFEKQKNRTSSGGITELFRLLSEGLNAFLHPVAPWRDDLIQKATLVLFGKIF